MKHLPLPADSGDAVILAVVGKGGWEGYRERWLAALRNYRAHGGDPWSVLPAKFSKAEGALLCKLYDSRRSSKPIEAIRHPELGHASCPICGSPAGPSIDHALPRAIFPEFSIVRENLVPACTMCNSDEKGTKYRGEHAPLRFIHPYFDEWLAGPIWRVAIGDDLDAPVFSPEPAEELSADRKAILAFHLSSVLGRSWRGHCMRYWGSLKLKLSDDLGSSSDVKMLTARLEKYLRYSVIEGGENSWNAAFLRGVLHDPRVAVHLASTLV